MALPALVIGGWLMVKKAAAFAVSAKGIAAGVGLFAIHRQIDKSTSASDMGGAFGPGTFIGDGDALTGGFSATELGLNTIGMKSSRQKAQEAGMLRGMASDLINESVSGTTASIGGISGDFALGGGNARMLSDHLKADAARREADRIDGRRGFGPP